MLTALIIGAIGTAVVGIIRAVKGGKKKCSCKGTFKATCPVHGVKPA